MSRNKYTPGITIPRQGPLDVTKTKGLVKCHHMVYLMVVCYLVNNYMVKLVIPDKLILVSVEYIVSFIP